MDGEDREERLMEGVAVLDFDMLCASVALQTQGMKAGRGNAKQEDQGEVELAVVQRMWEGGVLGCIEDRRIAVEAACCPCYRFGRNMGRARLGPCSLQGGVYFVLLALAVLSLVSFSIIKQHYFLYLWGSSAISIGLYAGYFRGRMRKKFNIRGGGSSLEDCIIHLFCPCCTLCQESRTLEMNNVQDGIWHGRGDTICVGSYGEGSKEFNVLHKPSLMPTRCPEASNMERTSDGGGNCSWNVDVSPSEPVFLPET